MILVIRFVDCAWVRPILSPILNLRGNYKNRPHDIFPIN